MSLLSIIIPLYNKEEYILDCLNSIIDCKYDFEIIVIDDGSTDHSAELVDNFSKNHPTIKIKLISQKNSGPSSARNKDVDMSEFDFSTSSCSVAKPQIKKIYNSKLELIKDLLNKKNIKSVVWGTLFKTQICKSVAFNEKMKWGEDSCYKLDYVLNSESGLYISNPYYVNRVLYNNTLSRQKISHEMLTSVIASINYYEKKLKSNKTINRDLCNRLFKTCVSYIKLCRNNKKEYLKEILLLKNKCVSYIKYIKLDSFKYLVYFCLCNLSDKIFPSKEK